MPLTPAIDYESECKPHGNRPVIAELRQEDMLGVEEQTVCMLCKELVKKARKVILKQEVHVRKRVLEAMEKVCYTAILLYPICEELIQKALDRIVQEINMGFDVPHICTKLR